MVDSLGSDGFTMTAYDHVSTPTVSNEIVGSTKDEEDTIDNEPDYYASQD